jgi:nicotinate-nucleotide adenylyltransferase
MKIALCGGTFDPFHRGHLDPLLSVRDAFAWDRIVYVPARRQPFKLDTGSASGFHRHAMAVLATQDVDDVRVSTWELERDAVSYTVDTLDHFRGVFADATLDWVIGDDNLASLHLWKDFDRIFDLANFVVLTRGGAAIPAGLADRAAEAASRPRHGAMILASNRTTPVSATEIRRRIGAGEPIDDLVDPRVSRYIHQYNLYRGATKGAA